MAIYYSRLSNVCRSKGHTVVAAAAYRAGARLVDERTDTAHDFTKRRGVMAVTMLAPAHAPWARDLNNVWSQAERAEVRCNARVGRELVVALPAELTDRQNDKLARRLGQDLVDTYGVAVLVALHAPGAKGDQRNHHVHLLMSTRVAGEGGFGAKVRVLDDQASGRLEAQAIRVRVADRLNEALTRAGHAARVDSRTLKAQASDAADRADFSAVVTLSRSPMRHQGRAATALARRGEASPMVEANAQRSQGNAVLFQWGTDRAVQLRRAVRARAERSARAPRTVRGQEVRKGLGTVGGISRATGADAELLNGQARAQEETLRAQRSDAEAYLDMLARVADQQTIAARADAERLRHAADDAEAQLATERSERLSEWVQRAATAAARLEGATDRHAHHRRAAALAQRETARARAAEAVLDERRPPPWRLMSRREWADLRRRQRAETQHRERTEREAAVITQGSAENVRKARRAAEDAQRKLRETQQSRGESPPARTKPDMPADTENRTELARPEEALFSGSRPLRKRIRWR